MSHSKEQLWQRFQQYAFEFPHLDLMVDLSRTSINEEFFAKMDKPMQKAFEEMDALERGATANPDEGRMVGHYWLRNPSLAPNAEIRGEIESTLIKVKRFASDVLAGKITGSAGRFKNMLVVGIGGSALGPQFVSSALSDPIGPGLRPFFLDNTDPDGMQRVFRQIGDDFGKTLCVVISKSGGTKETRNGMLESKHAYEKSGVVFERHAVAITGTGSELDKYASISGWIERFPMWDWVGGRTSELSAVGVLPAALQGIDVDGLLLGASNCDCTTRLKSIKQNPSALLALAWFCETDGIGSKNMVVLPYKDRLELFSKYLQQLIMESLGKELDRSGKRVNQGLTVLGNKGSTDQHSYVQQLRDGLNDMFVTFIEVLSDQSDTGVFVEPGIKTGDYLSGFYLGTRQALYESGRTSITITIPKVSPTAVGQLIALYERAVGFYASLVNINAYHQPGVEAGKKAATTVLNLQKDIVCFLKSNPDKCFTSQQIADGIMASADIEHVFRICSRLAANPDRGVRSIKSSTFDSVKFQFTN